MLLASWKQNFANPGVNWGGGYVLNHMNKEHLPLFEFAKQFYKAPINGRILDVGCGGGRHIALLRKNYPNSTVYGVDISPLSVKASRRYNKQDVALGNVEAVEGSVCSLPFPDNRFHLVTASETVYFWSDVLKGFQEIFRVLKNGGTLALYCDSVDPEASKKHVKAIKGMRVYTAAELEEFARKARFVSIESHLAENGRYCLIAKKTGNECVVTPMWASNPYITLSALWARALESRRPDHFLEDEAACEVVSNINYDFNKLAMPSYTCLTFALRSALIDKVLFDFLSKNREATVINLGAGLDTRLKRLPPESYSKWIDVDLPLNLDFRRTFFRETKNISTIAQDFIETSWIDRIPKTSDPKVVVIEGQLAYRSKEVVKKLFEALINAFNVIDVIFDLPAPQDVDGNGGATPLAVDGTKKTTVVSEAEYVQPLWTLEDVKALEAWSPAVKILEEYNLADYRKSRQGLRGLKARFPLFRQKMARRVVHLDLVKERIRISKQKAKRERNIYLEG